MKILRAQLAEGSGVPGTVLVASPLTVACGTGAIAVTEVQRAGKRPVTADEFLRGAPIPEGAVVG